MASGFELKILDDKIEDHFRDTTGNPLPIHINILSFYGDQPIHYFHSPGDDDWVYLRHPAYNKDILVKFPINPDRNEDSMLNIMEKKRKAALESIEKNQAKMSEMLVKTKGEKQ